MSMVVTFDPLRAEDYAVVAELGAAIWRQHFMAMITREQIDYMTAGRYTPDKLSLYLDAPDRWFRLLRVDGRPSGYFSYALTASAGEMKLEQLYLLAALRGRGLGGRMLDETEAAARAKGCATLVLNVNKHNADSIAVYRKRGFSLREEAVFDIGNGFVMDDYVMEKRLG